MSGYRIIGDVLAPIAEASDVDAIGVAIDVTETGKLRAVRAHLTQALEMLSDRESPDYRNSIKESISAVESIA